MSVTTSRRYLILLVCLVALGAADATTGYLRRTYPRGLFVPPPAVEREVRFLAEPYAVNPFQATDLDGRDVSFSTWHGRVAVVNFWATWCVPCRKEIPALVTLQETFKTEVIVVGVLDDAAPLSFVRAFAESLRINYPIIRTTPEIEHSFSPVLVLPTTYVVDPAGRVVSVHVGEIDPVLVEREVQALIAAEPAERSHHIIRPWMFARCRRCPARNWSSEA